MAAWAQSPNFPKDGTEIVTITQHPKNGPPVSTPEFILQPVGKLARWISYYTPNPDYNGPDSIKYTVENPNNDNGESLEATILFDISPVNDLPILVNDPPIIINHQIIMFES